jgi:hypothetical protein
MNRRVIAMVTTLLVAVGAATPALAGSSYSFVAKPTGIPCKASHLGTSAAQVRCDLKFIKNKDKAAVLDRKGRGKIKGVSHFMDLTNPDSLPKGASRKIGPFTCKSQRKAVACRTKAGHGFTVGPGFQLVF